MFDDDYRLRGSHATKAKFLCKDRGVERETGANVFERLIDVYMLAPIIGMLYGETAEVDTKSSDSANILASVMIKEQIKLKYIYRLIMLSDEKNSFTTVEKINKAFRDDVNKEAVVSNMEIFNSYVLGGIDVLYRKFTEDCMTKDDYLDAIYNFVNDFQQGLTM